MGLKVQKRNPRSHEMRTEEGGSCLKKGPTMTIEMHEGTNTMLGTLFQEYPHISILTRH